MSHSSNDSIWAELSEGMNQIDALLDQHQIEAKKNQ